MRRGGESLFVPALFRIVFATVHAAAAATANILPDVDAAAAALPPDDDASTHWMHLLKMNNKQRIGRMEKLAQSSVEEDEDFLAAM